MYYCGGAGSADVKISKLCIISVSQVKYKNMLTVLAVFLQTEKGERGRGRERAREEEYGEKRQKIMKQNKLNTASLTSHSATVCSLVCFLMFVYYFAHSFI